jgi:hypothetical protein
MAYFTSGGGVDDAPPPKRPKSPPISGIKPSPLSKTFDAMERTVLSTLEEAGAGGVEGAFPTADAPGNGALEESALPTRNEFAAGLPDGTLPRKAAPVFSA